MIPLSIAENNGNKNHYLTTDIINTNEEMLNKKNSSFGEAIENYNQQIENSMGLNGHFNNINSNFSKDYQQENNFERFEKKPSLMQIQQQQHSRMGSVKPEMTMINCQQIRPAGTQTIQNSNQKPPQQNLAKNEKNLNMFDDFIMDNGNYNSQIQQMNDLDSRNTLPPKFPTNSPVRQNQTFNKQTPQGQSNTPDPNDFSKNKINNLTGSTQMLNKVKQFININEFADKDK